MTAESLRWVVARSLFLLSPSSDTSRALSIKWAVHDPATIPFIVLLIGRTRHVVKYVDKPVRC